MRILRNKKHKKKKGFSLIEVLIGVALVAIAMLGLSQLFMLSIMNNTRSARMTNGLFLTQQQVEQMRALTGAELDTLVGTTIDEPIDINLDGSLDFRRITQIQLTGESYEIRVLVFAQEQLTTDVNDLITTPLDYNVRSDVTTIISR